MSGLRFDAFVLDPARGAVLRDGVEIELRAQSFAVLSHLAGNPGRLVSRDELLDAIWGDAGGSPDSLVQCVTEIRKALGDADHRIIKTVRGKGYRFVADISPVPPPPQTTPEPDPSLPRDVSPPAVPPQTIWPPPLIALGLLIAVLVGGGTWLLRDWAARPAELTMMAEPSLVILPVPPLGDDSDKALASLAAEIATGIWRAPRGFKPNIRPANAIKDAGADPMAIGREVGARYVVRTAARREGDVMHLNVEVLEAESGRQVWLGAFEYRPGERRAQYRTAARIGRTLAAEILRTEARRPLPARLEAGHFVILGRSLMNDQRSAKTNGEAIALFEKAIDLEKENFLALVHFARAGADHVNNGWALQGERAGLLAKAQQAVDKAIKREPISAGAFLTRGGVLRARGEYQQAIAAFEEALKQNPNFANAYAELGVTMIDVGQPEKTAELVQKALDINPDDFARYIWCYWAGMAALHMDQPAEALKWLRQSHEANSQYDNTLRLMAVALAHAGDEKEARKKMRDFLKMRPGAKLADWGRPDLAAHPNIAKQRASIRETMKRLLSEDEVSDVSSR